MGFTSSKSGANISVWTVPKHELAISHLQQVEQRVSLQREKISDMRARGLSSQAEEERLKSFLRTLEVLKTHLADIIDPAKHQARK
jgi:hypothetical protein